MSLRPTVLVYEFFTGGGSPPGVLPRGLDSEALGMLWTLLEDFRRWGAVRTITSLDSRFRARFPNMPWPLPADEVASAFPGEHEYVYLSLLKRCDFALVLAPETGGILAHLTGQAERAGVRLLSSNSRSVAVAGNKASCHKLFSAAELPSPQTRVIGFDSALHAAQEMGFPLVIKPVDGVGSEGVSLVAMHPDLAAALSLACQATDCEEILLQSYTSGVHASVSLLVAGNRCVRLSLNEQRIKIGVPFRYLGSRTPLDHEAAEDATNLACRAAGLIPGLQGYVGVDLVLTDRGAQLIEINPRLTTSYLSLRQVSLLNLAKAMYEACDGILPDRVPLAGYADIWKEDPSSWRLDA
jgi:tyramine---L-glutamate ligase